MEDDNKDKIIENNIINKNNEGNDIKEPENVKEIIQDNLNNNSQKESEKDIPKELKENNQALNINLKDNIFDKEFKKKEKERKKLEKQERKNKLLAKKHKSPEEIENEKIFAENNKILINFLGDSITEGLKWQKKEIFCFYLSKWLNIRINNQGYHATRIARQDDDDKDFNFRLKDLDEKADFTFIFGGTNDY